MAGLHTGGSEVIPSFLYRCLRACLVFPVVVVVVVVVLVYPRSAIFLFSGGEDDARALVNAVARS